MKQKENNVKKLKKMWKSAKKRPARPSFPSIDWSQQSLSLSISPQFLSTRPAPVPGSDRKKKCDPLSTFSATVPGSDRKKKVRFFLHIFSKLAPVPGSDRKKKRKTAKKKGAIFSPHFQ